MSAQATRDMGALLRRSLVLPVVTIDNAEFAVDLAQAFVRGGIPAIEVTLRTPSALPAIERIARAVPAITIAAGTILKPADLAAAANAGAHFAISPGATDALYGSTSSIPWLPGVATASEVMRGLAAGHRHFKFFPAVAAGGIPALQGLLGPFPDVVFCPTGGIGAANAAQFLALANVACVGGSWLAPPALLTTRDWSAIEALARVASSLAHSISGNT
jgi:2-dehydro-3-deoxyphosphogluconate aldolase/(4S)-4-hydroxy-2-oxoglutarate aldolase